MNKKHHPEIMMARKWAYFLISSLFPFYAFIQMSHLNTFSIYLTRYLGISNSQIGYLSASYIYTDAFLLLPVGFLLDRFSARTLLLIGVSLSALGGIIFASTQQFPTLCAGRIISGAGHAFALLSCFRIISLLFPQQKQGFFISLVITIALLGGLIAQTPLTVLIHHLGWRDALWANAISGIILLIILMVFLPKEKMPSLNVGNENLSKSLLIVAKNFQNWLCGFYACLLGLPLMLLAAVWGSTYLMDAKHFSALEASSVSSSLFFGTIVGSPFFGWLSDKLETRKLPMIGGALFSIIIMFIIIMADYSVPLFEFITLFFLLSFCASAQVLSYPVVNECNIESNNTAMGLVNVIIMGSLATLQIIFGWLWDTPALHSYAIYIFPATLVLSLVLSFFIKETL